MISEKELRKLFQEEGIRPVSAEYPVIDSDIVLDSEDIGEFIELCRHKKAVAVFYNYIVPSREEFEIDRDYLMDIVSGLATNLTISLGAMEIPQETIRKAVDMQEIMAKYEKEIDEMADEQDTKMQFIDWNTPEKLLVSIISGGVRIVFSEKEGRGSRTESLFTTSEIERILESRFEETYEEVARVLAGEL